MASLLIALCNALLPLATIWLTKELINELAVILQSPTAHYGQAVWLLGLQFGLAALTSTLRNVDEYMNKAFELRLDHDLAEAVVRKMATVPYAYLDLAEFHHHYSRISGAMGFRFLSPIKQVMNVVRELIRLASVFTYLLTFHWLLAVLSMLVAVPFLLFQSRFGWQKWRLAFAQTPAARDAQYSLGLLTDRQAAKEVRLFGLRDYLIARWSAKFHMHMGESLALFRRMKLGNNMLEMLVALFFACSAWIVIRLSQTKAVGVGDFIAVTQAIQLSQSSFSQMATLLAQIQEENYYLRDFFAFVDYRVAELEPKAQDSLLAFPAFTEGIRFQAVSCRYPHSEAFALQDVSFTVRAGEKIAIVGENGSGKTTLIKCLLGLYPVQAGTIYFDDVPLEQIAEGERQRKMSVVFQDFMKYAYTVHENIGFGNLAQLADEESVHKAARESGVDEFARTFPAGYKTVLGKFLADGEDLSGGQWQKIALARALFREGEIFVLDEPTSALDPVAEMAVFQQFHQLVKDKTAFFISHRMSAARMADRILVMKKGRLLEEGSHHELLAADGEYARMYRMQASWFAAETPDLKEVGEWRSPAYS